MKKKDGIYRKFVVRRTDKRDAAGQKHHGCSYFVLDLDHDPHVWAALKEYAIACAEDLPILSAELTTLLNIHRELGKTGALAFFHRHLEQPEEGVR